MKKTERKIVAIGGGENGRIKSDGTRYPYETGEIDREIIRLTGKERPNFLLIAHSQPLPEREEIYFTAMRDIYGGMYGCACETLKAKNLNRPEKVNKAVEWADIIYEGGGDTVIMLDLWRKTGFDKVLYKAWLDGKVLCGVSAGANCWFKTCNSDSYGFHYEGKASGLGKIDGLGFIRAHFTPHCNEEGRLSSTKEQLKDGGLVGIAASNCAAIEIIDGKYRLLASSPNGYGLKTYWHGNEYIEEEIDKSEKFKKLKDLLEITGGKENADA